MEFLPGGDMMTLLMKKDTLSEECTQVNDKKGAKIWKIPKFVSKTRISFYMGMSSKAFFYNNFQILHGYLGKSVLHPESDFLLLLYFF